VTVSRPARRDATAAGLRYVSPDDPGFERRRAGRAFRYLDTDGEPIRDAGTLGRIRSLAIPPAWTDVWICPDPVGHLQATGRDAKGRRQYRYHPRFRGRRDDAKFARMARFGKALPRIRRRMRRDLARRGLPREKVLAAALRLLESTQLRVGNAEYARLNKSFGLSTLTRRHATVSGSRLRFRFRGKGGRIEERDLVDPRLATVIRRCQELPGQRLFQYVDDDGEEHAISSEDVNAYLREAAGSDEFSAKDYRTWGATVLAHRDLGRATPLREALRRVADVLQDTVAVTRASYVHPVVVEAFDDQAGPPRPAKGASTQGASTQGASTPTREPAPVEPIDRDDELALLAALRSRRSGPSTPRRSARRSQVSRGSGRA
jgi:DNA topoisomerase-1